MTEKVFWQAPYLKRLPTQVVTVAGAEITVVRTIFYAQSGGQESDKGTIGGHPVLEARRDGREIVYRLPEDHGLRPGDPVVIEIDWERRYRLMRLHFAAEIVLELVNRHLGPVEKIGAHVAVDKARIDVVWPDNIAEHFPLLEAEALAIIAGDEPIESAFSDEAAERRYWKIEAFARVPCCGTHLRFTGEVGAIALKRTNIGKDKERIEVTLVEP